MNIVQNIINNVMYYLGFFEEQKKGTPVKVCPL